MTDETVADVLADAADNPRHSWLLEYVNGEVEAEELTYEDWVRPLKLTGGRVCLRCSRPWDGPDAYVARESAGHLVVWWTDEPEPWGTNVPWVTHVLEDDPWTVTPVLREDTPFAEEGQ